jgi:hypothetical protein
LGIFKVVCINGPAGVGGDPAGIGGAEPGRGGDGVGAVLLLPATGKLNGSSLTPKPSNNDAEYLYAMSTIKNPMNTETQYLKLLDMALSVFNVYFFINKNDLSIL